MEEQLKAKNITFSILAILAILNTPNPSRNEINHSQVSALFPFLPLGTASGVSLYLDQCNSQNVFPGKTYSGICLAATEQTDNFGSLLDVLKISCQNALTDFFSEK